METPRSPFSPSSGWMGHVVMNDECLHNISLIKLNHTHRSYKAVDDSRDLYTDPTCSKTAAVRRAAVRKAHTHFPARIKREGWQEQMEAVKRVSLQVWKQATTTRLIRRKLTPLKRHMEGNSQMAGFFPFSHAVFKGWPVIRGVTLIFYKNRAGWMKRSGIWRCTR